MSNNRPAPACTPASGASFGSDPYADHVGARLLEFFADATPWSRRLWDAGSVMTLMEVYDASEWVDRHVLSAGALAWLAQDTERLVGRDRGTGDRELRQQLQRTLRSGVARGGRDHRRLRELTDLVEDGYLGRWLSALDSPSLPAPERLARALASHLLDCGYSMGFLHRWARAMVGRGASLAEVFREAEQLADAGARAFDVLVPLVSVPKPDELAAGLSTWLDAKRAAEWLAQHGGAPQGVRQSGSFLFGVKAMDPYAAAASAALIVDRMVARTSYARALGGRLEPVGRAWVGDQNLSVQLRPPQRGAHVLSLVTERRLYAAGEQTALDDALELAAPLNDGSPGPAISGGWAAIESLLVAPRDAEDGKDGRGAIAADRLAALVAASWPRSELTALSYRHRPVTPDRLAAELGAETENRRRARLVADALASGRQLAVRAPGDQAAASRMSTMLDSPRSTLHDVSGHVATTVRRLYRQRNIVLHGGATGAIARDVTLRTAAPLVGAGLDRIVHAELADGVSPLEVAERALLGLALVGGDDGSHVVDLLAGPSWLSRF